MAYLLDRVLLIFVGLSLFVITILFISGSTWLIYYALAPLFILGLALVIKHLNPKFFSQYLLVHLFVAIILIQIIPMPRGPHPDSNSNFAINSGEPWAIGLGFPASYLKLYLGYYTEYLDNFPIGYYSVKSRPEFSPFMLKPVGDFSTMAWNIVILIVWAIPIAIIILHNFSLRKKNKISERKEDTIK